MLTLFFKRSFVGVKKTLEVNDRLDLVMLISSLGILVYTILVAINSDIAYDEAWTYMHYSLKEAPGFLDIDLANNHPLNSFLIYISAFLFPYSDFAIRFPNLVFLVIYLICAIKISKEYAPFKLIVFGLLVFYWSLTPFFFSQARGYGIATALVMLFLVKFHRKDKNFKTIVTSFYILLLASYAYVGLLPLVLAVALYYLFFEIRIDLFHFFKSYFIDFVFIFINLCFLAFYLSSVSAEGKPLFGALNSSFLSSTFGWYLNSFSIYAPTFNYPTLVLFGVTLALSYGAVIIVKKVKPKIIFITLMTFLIFYVSSRILNKPYITGRLLVPFYPLVVLSFFEFIRAFEKFKWRIQPMRGLALVIFALLLFNYLSPIKISTNTLDYKSEIFDRNNIETTEWHPSLIFYKNKFFRSLLKTQPTLKERLEEGFVINYYKDTNSLLFEADPKMINKTSFFLYINPLNVEDLPEDRKQYGFDKLDFFWFGYEKDGKKYILKKMPEYEYTSFRIGQYTKEKWMWERTIRMDEVQ